MPPSQTLACNKQAMNFENVRLPRPGRPARSAAKALREGTYAINLAQFAIVTEDQLYYLPLERDDKTVFQKWPQKSVAATASSRS